MSYVGKLRKKLFSVIDDICTQREKYFVFSNRNFTRRGKFCPQDIFKSLLFMENKSLSHELLSYFDFKKVSPTPSAFVQARAKIKSEAFEAVFDRFVSETTDNHAKYLYKGYRIFAVDGSDSHVPDNPDDADSYFPNPNGRHYNLFHINAMYDLVRHTYTDTVIQKKRTANEITAFIDMIKKHRGDTVPIIFTADSGYECYNDMAHITECGHKFVLRVKDIDGQGILSGLGLPDTYFDKCVTLKLTRRATQEVREMRKTDKYIRHIIGDFDYLPKNYDRKAPAQFYELPVRIIRFKVKNTSEVIMTNLEDFSVGEIKKIYSMRWGIETSFRDLKHTIGLNYYHAKKSNSILQEIYSRMVMYNFCQLITNSADVKPPKSRKGRKFAYKINFSQAVQICREFLRNKIRCKDALALIEKYILPIRSGKAHPRTNSPRREIYFNFRLA
jgi:hypothetical protein